jgi:hypothetical protein
MPTVDVDLRCPAVAPAIPVVAAGVMTSDAVDVGEVWVGSDLADATDQGYVRVPVVGVEDRERDTRVLAHVTEPEAARVHVQQHGTGICPLVPGGSRVQLAVGADGRDDAGICGAQKFLELLRGQPLRHQASLETSTVGRGCGALSAR